MRWARCLTCTLRGCTGRAWRLRNASLLAIASCCLPTASTRLLLPLAPALPLAQLAAVLLQLAPLAAAPLPLPSHLLLPLPQAPHLLLPLPQRPLLLLPLPQRPQPPMKTPLRALPPCLPRRASGWSRVSALS